MTTGIRPWPTHPRQSARVHVLALSGVGGFVDVVSFVSLAGLFTNQVTGNVIVAGAELAGATGHGAVPKLIMLPVFFLGVMTITAFAERLRGRSQAVLIAVLLGLESALLVVFMAVGEALQPQAGLGNTWQTVVVGATGVVAMSFQSALSRLVPGTLPTTIMTSNSTQLGVDTARWLLRLGAGADPHLRARLRATGPIVGSFFIGAALGALAASRLHLWSLAIPAAVVASLAALQLPQVLALRKAS